MMMSRQSVSSRKPFIIAILLHLLLFFVLTAGFQFTGKTFVLESTKSPDIINATVGQLPQLATPKPLPPAPTPPKPTLEPQPKPVPKPEPKPEPVKPIQQPPKVVPTPKTVTSPQKDVIALDKKKQKKIQEDLIAKQLLADLKKQTTKKKTDLKQKALEDAFASELKNLSKKKQSSQQQGTSTQERKAEGIIDKYKALVLQAVGRRWLIPSGTDKNLATHIVIFTAPGGMVLDAEVYKSSGNAALDNSAKAAVFKASPLPVPPDAEGFKFFRRFVLVFKPMYFQNGEYDPSASG